MWYRHFCDIVSNSWCLVLVPRPTTLFWPAFRPAIVIAQHHAVESRTGLFPPTKSPALLHVTNVFHIPRLQNSLHSLIQTSSPSSLPCRDTLETAATCPTLATRRTTHVIGLRLHDFQLYEDDTRGLKGLRHRSSCKRKTGDNLQEQGSTRHRAKSVRASCGYAART